MLPGTEMDGNINPGENDSNIFLQTYTSAFPAMNPNH
jgi:hypothetical protein